MSITKKEVERFTRPLDLSDIEWIPQFNKKDTSGRTKILPYINARTIEDRLREDFGIGNFRNDVRQIRAGEEGTVHIISLRFKHDDGIIEWIPYCGVGESSNVAALKGSVSASLKKAAGMIGMGRELYSFPHVYIDGANLTSIPTWAWKHIKELTQNIIDGKTSEFTYTLKDINKKEESTSTIPNTAVQFKPSFGK